MVAYLSPLPSVEALRLIRPRSSADTYSVTPGAVALPELPDTPTIHILKGPPLPCDPRQHLLDLIRPSVQVLVPSLESLSRQQDSSATLLEFDHPPSVSHREYHEMISDKEQNVADDSRSNQPFEDTSTESIQLLKHGAPKDKDEMNADSSPKSTQSHGSKRHSEDQDYRPSQELLTPTSKARRVANMLIGTPLSHGNAKDISLDTSIESPINTMDTNVDLSRNISIETPASNVNNNDFSLDMSVETPVSTVNTDGDLSQDLSIEIETPDHKNDTQISGMSNKKKAASNLSTPSKKEMHTHLSKQFKKKSSARKSKSRTLTMSGKILFIIRNGFEMQ